MPFKTIIFSTDMEFLYFFPGQKSKYTGFHNISTFSLNTAISIGVVPQWLDSVQNANVGWSPHVKYKSDPSSTGFAYGSALEGNEKIHGASCFEKTIAKTNKTHPNSSKILAKSVFPL